jgi:hypothetical protein
MVRKPRGELLIINNKNFEDPDSLPTREGSEIDVKNLEIVFHQLDFSVKF